MADLSYATTRLMSRIIRDREGILSVLLLGECKCLLRDGHLSAIGSDDLTTLIRKKDGHEDEVVSPKFDGSRNIRLEHRVTETYLAFIAT